MSTDTPEKKPRQRHERPPIRYLMSHDEAAVALAISPRKLDEWVAQGLLTKRKADGGVRYLVREVEALAESLPVMTPGVQPA